MESLTNIQRQGLNQSIRRDAADAKTTLASLKTQLEDANKGTEANQRQVLNMALDDIQDVFDFLENIEASAMALFEVEQGGG